MTGLGVEVLAKGKALQRTTRNRILWRVMVAVVFTEIGAPQFCIASERKTHPEAFEITRSVRLESPFSSVYALTLEAFLTSVEEARKDQSSAE